jgi:hypothetical protein
MEVVLLHPLLVVLLFVVLLLFLHLMVFAVKPHLEEGHPDLL